MSKYLKEYQQIGNCILNLDLIIKDWSNKFSISTYTGAETIHTLVINSRRKGEYELKVKISKEDAEYLINKLELKHCKSPVFNSGGTYHTQKFIDTELSRYHKLLQEKTQEIDLLQRIIETYQNA